MKIIKLITLLIFFLSSFLMHSQIFEWAKAFGSSSGWDEAKSIALDSNGNIYTTGQFEGTVDFNPSTAIFNLTSLNDESFFISKLDPNGGFIWAKSIDGNFQDSNAIAVDSNNNIYVVGSFFGQTDFDPGTGISYLTSNGSDRDVFILKLNDSGDFVWAKQISGISGSSLPSPVDTYSIAIDTNNDLYLTGYFDSTVDFDPSTQSTFLLTAVQFSDIYVCKIDESGNFLWAKQFGGTQGGVGYKITIDNNGDVISTGTIGPTATIDFDPGPNTFNLTNSSQSNGMSYVSKLDASGNFGWANLIHTGEGNSLAIDANNNVYAGGGFPISQTPILTKMDASGNLIWTKPIGGIISSSIAVDTDNNVYYTGSSFSGVNDYDPGPNVFNLDSGSSDSYITKLDASGNFLWAGLLKSTSQVISNSIITDNNDNLYVAGFFDGTTDFDTNDATFNIETPVTSYNAFVLKLVPDSSLNIPENILLGHIKVFPNPTNGDFLIELDKNHRMLDVKLYSIEGRLIYSKTFNNNNRINISINSANGIYFLKITNGSQNKEVIKLIKG